MCSLLNTIVDCNYRKNYFYLFIFSFIVFSIVTALKQTQTLYTNLSKLYQLPLDFEQVLKDMVSSTVYLMSSCYSVFLLMLFYVLYDEMAISSLYGIHQVHLITYVWFSLVCLGKFQNKRRCEHICV